MSSFGEAFRTLQAQDSLLEFIKQGWHTLEPGTEFVSGWAVEAICEHLEAVTKGEIRRLLINVPPGCTKSMTTNVFWPAWEWGPRNMPHLRYINAAYGQDLSIRDNLRCRDIMQSDWYRKWWGDLGSNQQFAFKSDQNAKIRYENDKAGWRYASSVGGALTGYRGDRIILDDPHSVQSGESEADRENTLRWFSETLPTRLNKLDESAIVVIMQRIHERDVSGLIVGSLEDLGYEHLCLPMEFEPDHPHLSTRFKDPRQNLGDLLWPERFSQRAVDELKEAFRSWGGSYAEAGQLQQRPVPRGGGMFQKDDFQFLDKAPDKFDNIVRGWDFAASRDGHGAYTVGVKMMALPNGDIVVLDVVRGRWSPGQVKTQVLKCADEDGPWTEQSMPQDPGQAGVAQMQDMAKMLHGYDFHFSPESGAKEDRARPLAAQCEARNVYLVKARWNEAFVSELCMFPNGAFKDQADAASRAYHRLIAKRPQQLAAGGWIVE